MAPLTGKIYKKAFKKGQTKSFNTSIQGCRTTIETIANAIGQDKVYFNGGSPIVFGAVKPAIRRAFEAENVYDMIEYDPTAPLDIDAIMETEFTMIEPTVAHVIDGPINAMIARVNGLRDQELADLAGIPAGGLPPAQVHLRGLDIEKQFRRDMENVESVRIGLQRTHYDQHRHWSEEREKFRKKHTALTKVFTKVFGVTTLSTINHYLN
eukprot:gene43037-53409_t